MLADLFFLTLGSTIANWTVGIGVLGGTELKQMGRNLLTPTLVATLAALLTAWFGFAGHIPRIVDHILTSAGSASVPMMLVLSGASLFRLSSLRVTWQVVYMTIVRLIILPAIMIAALRILPLSREVYSIARSRRTHATCRIVGDFYPSLRRQYGVRGTGIAFQHPCSDHNGAGGAADSIKVGLSGSGTLFSPKSCLGFRRYLILNGPMTLISAYSLSFGYSSHSRVLENISLDIEEKSTWAIIWEKWKRQVSRSSNASAVCYIARLEQFPSRGNPSLPIDRWRWRT